MRPVPGFTCLLALLLSLSFSSLFARQDSSYAANRALLFADSLVRAFDQSDWPAYVEMSYPGVIRYYGGKTAFLEHLQRTRVLSKRVGEVPEKIEMVQLLNDKTEWQCVIRRITPRLIEGKKAAVVSYLVGQSVDNGQHWTFFDVAHNPSSDLVYIMPDISGALSVPSRTIIFEPGQMAMQ